MKATKVRTIVIYSAISQRLLFRDAIFTENVRVKEEIENAGDSKEISEIQRVLLNFSPKGMLNVGEPLYFNAIRVLRLSELRKQAVLDRKELGDGVPNVVRNVAQNDRVKVVNSRDLPLEQVGGRENSKQVIDRQVAPN